MSDIRPEDRVLYAKYVSNGPPVAGENTVLTPSEETRVNTLSLRQLRLEVARSVGYHVLDLWDADGRDYSVLCGPANNAIIATHPAVDGLEDFAPYIPSYTLDSTAAWSLVGDAFFNAGHSLFGMQYYMFHFTGTAAAGYGQSLPEAICRAYLLRTYYARQ